MGVTMRSIDDVGGQLAAIRGTIAYYERTSEGVQHRCVNPYVRHTSAPFHFQGGVRSFINDKPVCMGSA